jgi:hypothetical protein
MSDGPKTSLPRKLLGLTLRLGLAAACLVYVFWDLDLRRALDTLAAFQAAPLLLSLLLGLALFLFQGLRFRSITGARATLFQATLACVLGNGLNNIFPARLGELGKALYLKRHADIQVRECLGFIFWERFADLNLILALAVLASLVSGKDFVWLPLALALGGVWVAVAVLLLLPPARRLLPRLIPIRSLRAVAEDMLGHFVEISTPAFLARLVLLSALVWASQMVSFAYNANGVMGLGVNLGAILAVLVASSLSFLIPSSPGGLGLYEAAMVFSFSWFGVDREAALILALLLRLTQNLPSILVTVLLLGKEQLGPKALHSALQSFRGNAAKDDPA